MRTDVPAVVHTLWQSVNEFFAALKKANVVSVKLTLGYAQPR
jgi:hypothetical protein